MDERGLTDEDPQPRRSWPVLGVLKVLLVSVIVLGVGPLLAAATSDVGVGRVAIGFHPAWQGVTNLVVPPLGQVGAATHRGPVEMRLELRSVDLTRLVDQDGGVEVGTIADDIRGDLPGAIRAAVLKHLVVGAVVGAVAASLLWRRHWRAAVGGAFVGLVVIAVLMGSAAPGFDAARFDDLAFEGSIASGSQLLAAITSNPDSGVGKRLETLSDKLAALYSTSVTDQVGDATGDTVILHVSDLHLNPIGVQLARQLADSFDVDAVLDTGDTTSFGSPFEGRFADLIADFPVPYLFVGGNHDSPANRAAIAAAPGVVAIDRRIATVGQVRILGFDDPVITTTRQVPRAERERIERDAAPELASLARRTRPDVIAVHNPVILQSVVGTAPTAVAGHLHRFELGTRKGTLISVVGSTGATGLGSLLSEADLPYSASLLRFQGRELVAIDRLEIVGTSGDLEIRRHTVTSDDRIGDTAGFIGNDVDEATNSTRKDTDATTMPVEPTETTTTIP